MDNNSLIKKEFNKEQSHQYFQNSKVQSCASVKIVNGNAQAKPYFTRPPLSVAEKMGNSSYTQSYSHATYKVRQNLHAGMDKKPLTSYDPLSYRNRLPVQDPRMPAQNASVIELGDRSQKYNRHFLSVAKNVYGNFGVVNPVTNPGIISERTKWHHKHQQQ